ncbi:lipoprotein [Sulfuricaulis limicola]|uniref:Lipoprotein n=1 Tax=Sulfuricaulis limicola TaxID=1620215 RepID=A0A1B4XHJ2_9GAMM|nr:C40 family peptidase [Sulfuricaulis limicola]BAV34268.1 lipoprotein [Sulfuricaulis limicola]
MRFGTITLLANLAVLAVLSGCGHTPAEESIPPLASRAADQALAMVGKPYRYGGNTPKGFDCSGLVQYSYARVGVRLPQGTRNLLQISQPISRHKLRRGDLVFFTQEGRRSSHVALYLGDDRFVHSPSSGKKVHVAGFDDAYWQRHFTEARRLEID